MLLPILQSLLFDISFVNSTLTNDFSNKTFQDKNSKFEISANIIPQKISTEIAPVIFAKSAIVLDPDSHTILFEKNINQKLAFASIAKLMTAIIIVEENDLNEIIEIKNNYSNVEGSKAWLQKGEKISYRDLLYLLLISSANDSAYALAEANSISVDAFVEKMNKKAKILGLESTQFSNPVGFDDENQKSTAYDLANLAIYAIQKTEISDIVRVKDMNVNDLSGINRHVENTNKLLNSYLNISGIKTGTTDEAGECLIALAEKDGHQIITVLLNSEDRFKESKILIEWIWNAYKW